MRILILVAAIIISFYAGFKYAQNQAGTNPQPLIDNLKSQLTGIQTQLSSGTLTPAQTSALQSQQTSILNTLAGYFNYTVAQVKTLLGIS